VTVRTAPATVAGRTETILVNAHGLPLYFYRPDTAAHPTHHVLSGNGQQLKARGMPGHEAPGSSAEGGGLK
jgi:hypothetical protein